MKHSKPEPNQAPAIPALILAGGLGTRLRAVDPTRPKPMVLIHGKPFLHWLVLHLARAGFCEFIFSTGYKAEQIQNYQWSNHFKNLKFSFVEESEPLGTGGATKTVFEKYPAMGAAWVINGDTLLTDPMPPREMKDHAHYSALTESQIFDASPNLVTEGENVIAVKDGGDYFDGGQVFVSRVAVEKSKVQSPCSLHKLLEESFVQRQVGYTLIKGTCYDIGTPERLSRFEKYLATHALT
jgi:NDP-sugar pyrophosphorylase family protein